MSDNISICKTLYVAVSRTSQQKYLNFCDVECQLQEGFNIINNQLTNKSYIGSTKTSIEQMRHHYIQLYKNLDIKNFKIKLVEKIPYIDDQQLLIAETANIIKFNSIEAGYNTKLRVSLEILY